MEIEVDVNDISIAPKHSLPITGLKYTPGYAKVCTLFAKMLKCVFADLVHTISAYTIECAKPLHKLFQ